MSETYLRTRQHWAVLIHPGVVIAVGSALVLLWAICSPHAVIHLLHLTTASPGAGLIVALYGPYKPIVFEVILVILVLALAGPLGWWSITWYEISHGYLRYQRGPFDRQDIPIAKIQDCRVVRGMVALMLGYGTIEISSGRSLETLTYVPNVELFKQHLEWEH